MTVSSLFSSAPSFFSRSKSSPNIPDLAKADPPKVLRPKKKTDLPRAASYTYLPLEDGKTLEVVGVVGIGDKAVGSPADREGRVVTKTAKEDRPRGTSVGRKKTLRPKSWIQKAKGSSERSDGSVTTAESSVASTEEEDDKASTPILNAPRFNRRKSVSESIASFARKPWSSTSRSPSPTKATTKIADVRATENEKQAGHLRAASALVATGNEGQSDGPADETPSSVTSEKRTALQKLKQRPQSVLISFTSLTSANSSTSSLHSSSFENKSTPRTSIEKVPPIPKTFSTDKLVGGTEGHKKRDELGASFRSLDNDFSKFQSKSWSLKTNIVRSSVLPFLKNHADHPSNTNLRSEDLERRTVVLNKWWAGLLEVLDGRQNQTVSGVDRPVLLEACYCIMVRPEWRAQPSTFGSLSTKSSHTSSRPSLHTKKSSASVHTLGSQLMAENVIQNIRTQFIQNLLTQTAFVVDKMSLRNAPASLTTFCGKALAYAFFFVPGIADILVRIWKLSAETIRRVVNEYNLPMQQNLLETLEVVSEFPSHLASLGWTTPKKMFMQLRRNAESLDVPVKIRWYGPWTARWCGRDSDLLFVFAKHYFILCEEFLNPELPLTSKCRAPGFILLQAQLMTVLDGTTHRQHPDNAPVVLDDVLGAGVDAIAAALPFPTNNTARPMAENRIVMLLRDFLSEHSSEFASAQRTFAEVFSKTVQASAHRTSLHDHNACFVLCDFMEESVQIVMRYQTSNPLEPDHIDWRLWMKVCQMMLESQNTMTQIRLFAFLYSLWNLISGDPRRKEVMAVEWLLSEEMFTKFFLHWCPMVRAYYMRLLCWRLCRDDGEASTLDTKLFALVSTRLKMMFSYYLFTKQNAEANGGQLPSSTPCHPAPGRRLLIIRNDFQAPAGNIFLGFDGIIPPTNSAKTSSMPFKRHAGFGFHTDPSQSQSPQKDSRKRWSILGKSSASRESGPSSAPVTPSNSPPKHVKEPLPEVLTPRNSRAALQRAGSSATRTRSEPPGSYKTYCFKFSLEWSQNFDRNGHKNNISLKIVSPRLPNPAQACISARVPATGNEVQPKEPGSDIVGAKYAGRALAEWALVVGECNNFVERRRMEGVPGLKFVEVPLLGVDGFRRFGG